MTTKRQQELREGYIASGHPRVMDELCTCGCYRSQHSNKGGTGGCYCLTCVCTEFTWEAFLVKEGPLDIEGLIDYNLNPPAIVATKAIAMPAKV